MNPVFTNCSMWAFQGLRVLSNKLGDKILLKFQEIIMELAISKLIGINLSKSKAVIALFA